jgi:hypothetical protein
LVANQEAPGRIGMSAQSALFVKLYMSREMYGRWMASPVKFIDDYDDWRGMNSVMASSYEGWRDEPRQNEFASVGEFLDGIADYSRYFHSEYDEAEKAVLIADAKHRSKMREIAASVAALRGASDFVDDTRPGFVYVFPALAGGDPEALLRVEGGKSYFLFPDDSSPETLYFVNEAEEFIEAMLEDSG